MPSTMLGPQHMLDKYLLPAEYMSGLAQRLDSSIYDLGQVTGPPLGLSFRSLNGVTLVPTQKGCCKDEMREQPGSRLPAPDGGGEKS